MRVLGDDLPVAPLPDPAEIELEALLERLRQLTEAGLLEEDG